MEREQFEKKKFVTNFDMYLHIIDKYKLFHLDEQLLNSCVHAMNTNRLNDIECVVNITHLYFVHLLCSKSTEMSNNNKSSIGKRE